MRLRTGLLIIAITSAIMMIQAVILTFWCESASIFSFRVEDLTPLERNGAILRYPVLEFKSTIPGFLDFAAVLLLTFLLLRGASVRLLGVQVSRQLLALAILGLTAWNLVFAAFLVILEFKYLQPCPV